MPYQYIDDSLSEDNRGLWWVNAIDDTQKIFAIPLQGIFDRPDDKQIREALDEFDK